MRLRMSSHIDNLRTFHRNERNENCARRGSRFKAVMTSPGGRKRRFLTIVHTMVEAKSRASTWRAVPMSLRQDRKFLFADVEGRDVQREYRKRKRRKETQTAFRFEVREAQRIAKVGAHPVVHASRIPKNIRSIGPRRDAL